MVKQDMKSFDSSGYVLELLQERLAALPGNGKPLKDNYRDVQRISSFIGELKLRCDAYIRHLQGYLVDSKDNKKGLGILTSVKRRKALSLLVLWERYSKVVNQMFGLISIELLGRVRENKISPQDLNLILDSLTKKTILAKAEFKKLSPGSLSFVKNTDLKDWDRYYAIMGD